VLKIPFIKRENYIVLKAYTFNLRTAERSPIVNTYKVKPSGSCPADKTAMGFKTCLAWIKTQRQSLTIPMWTEMECKNFLTGDFFRVPSGNFTSVIYQEEDSLYGLEQGTHLMKILAPWACETNKPEVDFIFSKHILNHTPMDIVTGVLSFSDYVYAPNIFYRHRDSDNYKVRLNTPLVSMYPTSDLPLHVECYCDPAKYQLLHDTQISTRPYFRATGLKDVINHRRNQ
jgi:hypothetical protein